MIRNMEYLEPVQLLSRSLRVFLKDGGKFYFKVTNCGPDYIGGYDDEGLDLQINIVDIDFIIGG